MPRIRSISLDQYKHELGADPMQPSDSDRTWDVAFQLLGLLPMGQTIASAENDSEGDNVAAYYDPHTKSVTVINREPTDEQQDLFVLSHEFVHALQDAQVDLSAFEKKWARSTDSEVAVHTLFEGEATILGADVLAGAAGRTAADTDWSHVESSLFDSTFMSLDGSTAPFFELIQALDYPIGTQGLTGPWLSSGQDAIDAFYKKPPLSLLDWIEDTKLGSTAVEAITCLPTAAPQGYTGQDHDTLGIAGATAMFMQSGKHARDAYDSSAVWRNDVVVTFTPDDPADASRAVAWRTRWHSAAHATFFKDAAQKAVPSGVVTQDGTDVIVRAATDASVLATWDASACGTADDLPVAAPPATGTTMMSRIGRVRRPPAVRPR